ncbi:MAG: hypothetical protein RL428_489 [Actinomycetota bacterium]
MANYTADDVKRLREATAAGMLDCKKALDEAEGDYDKAVEIIRVKGLKGVTKREGRLTSNGLVVAKVAGDTGVMLELNCETDFVAKGERFIALGDELQFRKLSMRAMQLSVRRLRSATSLLSTVQLVSTSTRLHQIFHHR